MWKCRKCREEVDDDFDVCWNCQTGKDGSSAKTYFRTAGSKKKRSGAPRSEASVASSQAWQPWRRNPEASITTGDEAAKPTEDASSGPLKLRHYIFLFLSCAFLLMYLGSIWEILSGKGGWDTPTAVGSHTVLLLGLLLVRAGLRPLMRRRIMPTWALILFAGVSLSFTFGSWIWGLVCIVVSIIVALLTVLVPAAIADKREERRLLSDPEMAAYLDRMIAAPGENPVCPKCRTIYNRVAVVKQLRQQSPEMFDFMIWTTRFRCVECGEELAISGPGDADESPTTKGPTCGRCKKALTLEPDDPLDAFQQRIKGITGSCYLATVCKQCGWIECYKCRGKVGAPCSKCSGSVSPAYKRQLG